MPHACNDVVALKKALQTHGFDVGAIRPPTVETPMLRIIPRLEHSVETLKTLCTWVQKEDV